jgi:hypothetical protein
MTDDRPYPELFDPVEGRAVVKIRLKVTKAQVRRLTRVARWEKLSLDTVLTLEAAHNECAK